MTKEQIRASRVARQMTQAQAAAVVGVATRTWRAYELGEHSPSAQTWELFLLKTSTAKYSV